MTGNPVRPELAGASRNDARSALGIPQDASVLLVLGGSGGSRPMNEAVVDMADVLLADDRCHIIWQTGTLFESDVPDLLRRHAHVHVKPYIDRMDEAYAAADLAFCRAGASTCSELLATGTPSLLVPSPFVAEDHQTKNAQALVRLGAAELLPQRELKARGSEAVRRLLDNVELRAHMREVAKAHAVTDAAARIADDILGHVRSRGQHD
jgi:UDP-N-acetylglucosamine--N-acetylmuramyl-(pentapeptide) pyrophosphoryl-undecaprenol N-acetylglucosamine transferase